MLITKAQEQAGVGRGDIISHWTVSEIRMSYYSMWEENRMIMGKFFWRLAEISFSYL